MISIIAAIGNNNALGKDNQLLWHLPADMKHFKELTSGHTVIMGRKTFESIGKPLPNRRNIVITRDGAYWQPDIEVAHSLEEALKLALLEYGKEFEENQEEVEVFIIGGGEIYNQAMNKANKLYITQIDNSPDADTFFPKINLIEWKEISREEHGPDEAHSLSYAFIEYSKKSA
jgi:dihydrofolate reductase